MRQKPRYAKVHSQAAADELARAGWSLRHEFINTEDDEPYEFILEWLRDEEPVAIDWAEFSRKHRQDAT